MSASPVYLNEVTTAVPPHDIHDRFLNYIPSLLRDRHELALFKRLVSKAQIKARYSYLRPSPRVNELDGDSFYVVGHFPTTAKRIRKYESHALELATEALVPLFKNYAPASITHLIVTSCTGSYAPGLDLEIVKKFGLSRGVERTMIGFMGCYAAINALKSAFHIVRSLPESNVLLINIELCTLHLQENAGFESILSFLQFADGCAASVISAKKQGIELLGFRCDLIPENNDLIQWHVGDSGYEMKLALEVPKVLGKKLREMAPQLKAETTIWAVHPGGRSILDAVETNLDLSLSDLDHSRKVLSDFGNMSSATVMFVLKRIIEDASLWGRGMAMAFGPGLSLETCSFLKLEQAHDA